MLGQAPTVNPAQLASTMNLIGTQGSYSLLRSKDGVAWQMPSSGTVSFEFKQGEALLLDERVNVQSFAKIENAKLRVDFGNMAFSTSLDLVSEKGQRYQLGQSANVFSDGTFRAFNRFTPGQNMNLSGVLGGHGGGSAVYVFQGRVDPAHVASGVTVWGK